MLNLPPCGYSWQLQRACGMLCRSGSYQGGHEAVLAWTGNRVGKRQLQEIVEAAAADAAAFARARPVPVPVTVTRKAGGGGCAACALAVLVLSADGKGVLMRKDALRRDAARRAAKRQKTGKRLGTGQKKGSKRIAETGAVLDSLPHPDGPRTPQDIMCRPPGQPSRAPDAVNKWYTCGITATRAEVIAVVFAEAARRDPARARHWLALVDGDLHQIGCFEAEAAALGKKITILIDFIHVIEYLRKAAWCFTPAGDTAAAEKLVTGWALAILAGNTPHVISHITSLAAAHPPAPGSEHDKNIRRTAGYLRAKKPYLGYPQALAKGWPIATGIIEGACRHLVADRMNITGARWSLPGAQAMLWMRAIHASGDTAAYWNHHIHAEHHRNHLTKFKNHPAPRHDLHLAA